MQRESEKNGTCSCMRWSKVCSGIVSGGYKENCVGMESKSMRERVAVWDDTEW